MLRVLIFFAAAAAIFAQDPQAPPEVDAALRARVSQFYRYQVEEKYNQALQLVAEDTKDLFVGSNKAPPRSFEIKSIRYSDDFTKAEVVVLVTRMLTLEGFVGQSLAMKMLSRWKLENAVWCYYVDPVLDVPASPFGKRAARPGMPLPAGGPPGAPSPGSPVPGNFTARRPLTVDRLSVQLKSSGASAEQVTITNPGPLPSALIVSDPKVAGLTVKVDPAIITAGQKATLHILWSGEAPIPKAPVTVKVTVQQTNQMIPVRVSFSK